LSWLIYIQEIAHSRYINLFIQAEDRP
jgi:hypothetical protein